MINLIIHVLFPAFGTIAIGAIAEKFKILGTEGKTVIVNLVINITLPLFLFNKLAQCQLNDSSAIPFMFSFSLGLLIVFTLSILIFYYLIGQDLKKAALFAILSSAPNTSFMGIPILFALLGKDSIVPIAISTALMLILSCIPLIIIKYPNKKHDTNIVSSVFSILSNPLILSIIAGFFLNKVHIQIPIVINNLLYSVGIISVPCAMFAVGQSLVGHKFLIQIKNLVIISILKLFIQPITTLSFLFLFKINSLWAISGFVLSALPVATIGYIFAFKYGISEQEIATYTIIETVLSIITLTVVIILVSYIWPNFNYLPIN
jgi:hypothetical protein